MYTTPNPDTPETASSQPPAFTQDRQGHQESGHWLMANALTPLREARDVNHSCSSTLLKVSHGELEGCVKEGGTGVQWQVHTCLFERGGGSLSDRVASHSIGQCAPPGSPGVTKWKGEREGAGGHQGVCPASSPLSVVQRMTHDRKREVHRFDGCDPVRVWPRD